MTSIDATLAPRVRIAGNEAGKGLHLLWRRRAALAMGIAANAASFLVLRFFIDGGHILHPLLVATLPGMAAAAAASIASLGASGGVAEELNAGTLEQTHLSPVPPWALAAGRLGALALEALLVAGILGIGFVLGFGVHYHADPAAIPAALLTLADIAGYALLVAGLTITVASVGAIVHVLNGVILFFNGTLVPLAVFPGAIQVVAELLPTTLGVRALHDMLVDGRTLSAVWDGRILPLLLAHAVALLAIGWATYQASIRRALRDGRLGP